MPKFEFVEKGHKYYLDGKAMTGVTTVLGVIAKPALISWAANQAVEYILEHGTDPETLEAARKAHIRKRDDAAAKGTDTHAEVEKWVKSMISANEGKPIMQAHENVMTGHFINWAVRNNVQFLESEKRIYSEKHFIAGTADLVLVYQGKKYLADIKTTSGIYDRTPFAQCAAYRMMLEEHGETDFHGSMIINLKKTGKFNEDKDVYISEHYEDDLELFMAALTMYRNVGRFQTLHYQFKNK